MTSKQLRGWTRATALVSLVLFSACRDDADRANVLSPSSQSRLSLGVKVSDLNANVGDRITVAVEATSSTALTGVQGRLRFDPARLEYLGQLPDNEAIVIVNESLAARGDIRVASFTGTILTERVAKFAFKVRSSSYTGGLVFMPEVVGDLKQNELRATVNREVALDAQLSTAKAPVHWSYIDWAYFVDPSLKDGEERTRLVGLPPAGTIYGDPNLDGVINVLDASDVANTAVGNREIVLNTDTVNGGTGPRRDRATSANVRPVASAQCAAGSGGTDCGDRAINVLDASPIAAEALGTDVPVVGDAILLPRTSFGADTLHVAAGTLIGTRVFHRDTLYILDGTLIVGDPSTGLAGAGELQVESGTTVEGTLSSAVYVTRNGRFLSLGTPNRPVTFTCHGVKAPGCWGGVFIAGNAVTNEQDASLPGQFAPLIPGRNPVGGEKQRAGEGGAVNHGGGNDADSSGVIFYTRFMYGGKILFANNELNDLTLGSCGSHTHLDHIQTHGGLDDGLELFGGRCNVKHLYSDANDDDQFDYSYGYDGNVQFVVVSNCRIAIDPGAGNCDKGFEVDNTETTGGYNALPRTNATIYNVTSIGGCTGGCSVHFHYRRGAGGTIRNALLVNGGVTAITGGTALFHNQTESCPVTSGLNFGSILTLGVPNMYGANSEVPANCQSTTFVIGTQVDTASYTGQLKDPFNRIMPDFSPVGNGVTTTVNGLTPATPPNNGFFDTSATYFGAAAPLGTGPLPFWAGWTLPWQGNTTR